MRSLRYLAAVGVSMFAISTSALAQENSGDPDDRSEAAATGAVPSDKNADDPEIVVTGTLIRGIAPGGTQSFTISNQAAETIGATSSSQLLASVPQGNTFAGRPAVLGSNNSQLSINRPNLRSLPGNGSGGASTLVLVDGHRLVGMGIRQTSPDTDAIALGAIERVEIVPDGGSSIYGADAVGGVINYITRKRFDGVEVSGKYGFAGDYYDSWDATATVGKTWDNGGIYISYNYSQHSEIYGRDLDFVRRLDYSLAGTPALDLSCSPGNVIANGQRYTLPSFTPVAANSVAGRCDLSDNQTVYPRERRHSVFAAMNVDLSDSITFDVRAFYMNRRSVSDGGPLTGSVAFRPTVSAGPFNFPNANYQSTGDANGAAQQTVLFDFSPVFGRSSFQTTTLDTWGVTPSFRIDLGNSWQVNAFFNYGRTKAAYSGQSIDALALGTQAFLGGFNPYNIAAPGNATFLSTIRQSQYDYALQEMFNERVVADGTLLSIPGGDVKLAFGAEHSYEKIDLSLFQGQAALIPTATVNKASRHVSSLFGEVSIPIIGEGNRGGFHAVTLSASGRYDHYNDFGGTFNPKFGVSIEPTDWLKLRGNWGKSFQAPSLADTDAAQPASIAVLPSVIFPAPGTPVQAGQVQIFVSGGGANLKPQRATTWSLGFDIQPPVVPGLRASVTYYNVKFRDIISMAPIFNPSVFFGQFPSPEFYRLYTQPGGITANQLQALATGTSNPNAINPYLSNLGAVYSIGDATRKNLGRAETDGFDFSVNYSHPTGFGSVFGGFNGTYILSFKEQAVAGTPLIDNVEKGSRFRFSANVGAEVGNLRAQMTLLHTAGYNVDPTVYAGQSRVGGFNLVNLFFKYDVPGDSLFAKDLSFTANIDNVFNQDPPALQGALNNQFGYAGFTLGRQVQFGINKKF
jgi:iron complex outermembrane receptor protein